MTREQFNALRERALWDKLSSELKWTEELLSKYADKVNWETISSNENVLWTESLIRRFANKLNWRDISRNDALSLKSPEIIRPFALYWHWSEKTRHTAWTPDFIEEMKDYLDWEELFEHASYEQQELLLQKYFQYICQIEMRDPSYYGSSCFDEYVEHNWQDRANEILNPTNS